MPVGSDNHFRSGFAGAVGVAAPERIGFQKSPSFLAVAIHFVGRHHDHGPDRCARTRRFEQAERATHIGGKSFHRLAVAPTNKRLCRQMKHDFGLERGEMTFQRIRVPHIRPAAFKKVSDAREFKKIRAGRRAQRVT